MQFKNPKHSIFKEMIVSSVVKSEMKVGRNQLHAFLEGNLAILCQIHKTPFDLVILLLGIKTQEKN